MALLWLFAATTALALAVKDDEVDENLDEESLGTVEEQYDIIFLLDSSSGVSYDSFLDQMEFVGILNDCFETFDHTKPTVSVMTYGDKVRKLSDLDVNSEDDMIGGNRRTDEALARALEQFEESDSSGYKEIILVLNDAPMSNHEPCLDDYVSPTLQKLRNMDVHLTTVGINLDEEEMNNLLCTVPGGVLDEFNEDSLVNTDTMVNLAKKWGYEHCANQEPLGRVEGQYDLVFLLDSSSGVSYDSFSDQMHFVGTFTTCMTTYMKPKVGVMTYGDKVRNISDFDIGRSFSIGSDDMIGGGRWADNALAKALELFEENEADGSSGLKTIVLMLNGAPMINHEPCLYDYVSPTLQKLRNMGVQLATMGINLDEEEMNNLLCTVPEDMRDELMIEDYLVNTDTMVNLAQEWGYTDCANGEHDDE